MTDGPSPQKIPLVFFRTAAGSEPVREWLKELPEAERHTIGQDLLRAQWRWPVGMPLCRPLGNGLWEIPDGPAGEAHSACTRLSLPRAPGGAACVHQENAGNAR